jgi:hypothetical protein
LKQIQQTQQLTDAKFEACKFSSRTLYNLRKRKGRTVYVSASKIFRLEHLRDTDHVIEAMKKGYEVSIGRSFFAGSGGGAKMGKQDGRGNQQDDTDTDDDQGEPQPEQDIQDTQPQQRKQPRMLTNLARYNPPGIKDNKNVSCKRNQCDKHQMASECEKKRDRIAKSDGSYDLPIMFLRRKSKCTYLEIIYLECTYLETKPDLPRMFLPRN